MLRLTFRILTLIAFIENNSYPFHGGGYDTMNDILVNNVIIDNQDFCYFQNYKLGVMERLMKIKFQSENGIIRGVFYDVYLDVMIG